MSEPKPRKKTKSAIVSSDPISQLYRAVERYVTAHHGSVLVIGGIQLQEWPGEGEYNFSIAVKCTGKRPIFPIAGWNKRTEETKS